MISSDAEPAPADAADQEGPEVLDDLQRCEPALRQADGLDPAVADGAAVGDADDAAGRGDELGVVQHRLGDPQERVLLDHRVGVDVAAGTGWLRRVDAGVQRVGLAAVLLAQHPQRRDAAGDA